MKMLNRIAWLLLSGVTIVGMNSATAAEMFAYPTRGQSQDQQQADRQSCESWATQQAGSTPPGSPSSQASPSQTEEGGPLRGAMRGRMIGEAAGNPDAGMMGGGIGGLLRHKMEKEREEEQAQPAQKGNTDAHDRAFKACMEGRGYTVE